MLHKGFTLIELCIVMILMSILFVFVAHNRISDTLSYYSFPANYLRKQSEAILEGKDVVLEDEYSIPFNENGNVKQAQTLHFRQGDIVTELGGGRLVFK